MTRVWGTGKSGKQITPAVDFLLPGKATADEALVSGRGARQNSNRRLAQASPRGGIGAARLRLRIRQHAMTLMGSAGVSTEFVARLRDRPPVVLPSLLLCDFGHLADEIARVEAAGVRALHLDVMDGHFVPNITYGMTIVEAVRKETDLLIDVHLMIDNPENYLEPFYTAGADQITIHTEAVDDAPRLLESIRKLGAAAGLALSPPTPLSHIEHALPACDTVLVLSVMPGFGGQQFDPVALEKLNALRRRDDWHGLLQVDGGVNRHTIESCAAAGADLFVVGSAIFSSDDYTARVKDLTDLATKGIRSRAS